MTIRLAVDAMGGDHAPHMVLEGVARSQKTHTDVFYELYGDKSVLTPLLKKYPLDPAKYTIIHTEEVVTSEMKPSLAVRGYKDSSMRRAIEAVAQGQADAVVSAGNTGAYMALSKLILKSLPGIERPAIVAPMPTIRGRTYMLDLGANVECSTDNLIQFAIMGQIYAEQIGKIEKPALAILNVGTEDLKGTAVIKNSHVLLKSNTWIKNYTGFVEGDGLLLGKTDVVVTDGFTGNVALKTAEGTFHSLYRSLVDGFNKTTFSRIVGYFAKPILAILLAPFDPNKANGAPFLGLNGISVKSHGGANAKGFSNALNVASDMVQCNLNTLIRDGLEEWQIAEEDESLQEPAKDAA